MLKQVSEENLIYLKKTNSFHELSEIKIKDDKFLINNEEIENGSRKDMSNDGVFNIYEYYKNLSILRIGRLLSTIHSQILGNINIDDELIKERQII